VQLSNVGSAPLMITSIAASGDFHATNNCPASLAVSASCTISVVMTPTAAGQLNGTLTVIDNAYNSTQTLALTGFAEAPFTFAPATGSSTSVTVSKGGTASYNLQLTTASGMSGNASLSCSNAPIYATCNISPTALTLASGATGSFTVTVTTQTTTSAMRTSRSTIVLACLGVFSLLTVPLLSRGRRRGTLTLCLLFAASLCLGCVLTGCGGGGNSSGTGPSQPVTSYTPSGTYTLTVTATSGSATTGQSLKLIVN